MNARQLSQTATLDFIVRLRVNGEAVSVEVNA